MTQFAGFVIYNQDIVMISANRAKHPFSEMRISVFLVLNLYFLEGG